MCRLPPTSTLYRGVLTGLMGTASLYHTMSGCGTPEGTGKGRRAALYHSILQTHTYMPWRALYAHIQYTHNIQAIMYNMNTVHHTCTIHTIHCDINDLYIRYTHYTHIIHTQFVHYTIHSTHCTCILHTLSTHHTRTIHTAHAQYTQHTTHITHTIHMHYTHIH